MKLKAFTILELTVVLVLTGLVAGISYSAYTIVYKQYIGYKKTSESTGEIMRFYTALGHDLTNAREVEETSGGFLFTGGEGKITDYKIYDTFVIRHTDKALPDTFKVETTGTEAEKISIKRNNRQHELVEKLFIEVTAKGEILPLYFKKNYGLDILMAQEE